MTACVACFAEDRRETIVTFPADTTLSDPLNAEHARNLERKAAYLAIPVATRKKLESLMVGNSLGISGTGRVKLVGVYLYRDSKLRQKSQRLFHLIFADLFENRLQWSILFDSKKETVQVLYRLSDDLLRDIPLDPIDRHSDIGEHDFNGDGVIDENDVNLGDLEIDG